MTDNSVNTSSETVVEETNQVSPEVNTETPVENTESKVETPAILGSETAETKVETESEEVKTESESEVKMFKDLLSDEYKNEKSLSTFKDADSMAKAYINLQKLVSKKITSLSPEELKQIDKNFGAPETAEEYDIKANDIINEDDAKNFAKIAHEIGIPKEKFEKLFSAYSDNSLKQYESHMEKVQLNLVEEERQLKKEFGVAFDQNIKLANEALRKFGGQDLVNVLTQNNLQNNPALVKAFTEMGKIIADDTKIGETKRSNYIPTPEEAKQKAVDFRKEYSEELNSPNHKDHAWAVEKLNSYYKLMV